MNRIREIRKKNKITAEKMAEILEISTPYLYDLENGRKRLNEDIIYKIIEHFNLSADYILGTDSKDKPNSEPDLNAPLNEKNKADALLKISELDSMFNLPDETVLTMLRAVKEKFGELSEGGGKVAHGPKFPGSGALREEDDDG